MIELQYHCYYEELSKATKQSAIHWATTNQGFSELRDNFIQYVYIFIDQYRYDTKSKLFQLIKSRLIDSLIRDIASTLTKAQQNKLRIVLERIGA